MVCWLYSLYKILGLQPMDIEEKLQQSLVNLVLIAEWYQAKTAFGNLHLCAILEAVIEGDTYSIISSR